MTRTAPIQFQSTDSTESRLEKLKRLADQVNEAFSLSVRGEPGPRGIQGIQGDDGPQGVQGNPGPQGDPVVISSNASIAVGGTPLAPVLGISAAYLPADPSGLIGMVAVNGTSTAPLRSDGRHAIDPAIAPVWTGNHNWVDSARIRIGTGNDLDLYHDGTNSYITNVTGVLIIENTAAHLEIRNLITRFTNTGGPLFRWIDGDSALNEKVAEWRNSASVVTLTYRDDSELNPLIAMSFHRTGTTPTSVRMPQDNEELQIGAGQDLRLNHDGTDSSIRNDTGELKVQAGAVVGMAIESTGAADMRQQFQRSNVISPAQLVANTDNWAPAGLATATTIRFSTDAARNITGITAQPAGTEVLLVNIGAQNAVLVHDATSTAANRFLCPGAANFTLNAGDACWIWYDTGSSRWRVIAF